MRGGICPRLEGFLLAGSFAAPRTEIVHIDADVIGGPASVGVFMVEDAGLSPERRTFLCRPDAPLEIAGYLLPPNKHFPGRQGLDPFGLHFKARQVCLAKLFVLLRRQLGLSLPRHDPKHS